ncbi:MAG: ComEC/Rec2 family competence protein [Oscillospiraceae bacterium]
MKKEVQDALKLVPVRAAPFFTAGMLLCAGGGAVSIGLTLCAAILCGAVRLMLRSRFVEAASLFLGMALMTGYIHLIVQPVLASDGQTQQLTCTVSRKYDYGGYSGYVCNTFVSGRKTCILLYHSSDLQTGDKITALVDISAARNNSRSPAQQILLRGSIKELIGVDTPRFSLVRSIGQFRQNLSDAISAYIGADEGALAQGLLFGDTSGFSAKLSYCAKVGGVMHFTAVSGTHFIIIMSVLLEILGKKKRSRAIVSAICIPLAVLFFGAEPSVLRAGIMLFLCNCGPLFRRRSEKLNSLCISAILITATAPYILLDIGFQMSVLGVFGVTVVSPAGYTMLRALRLPKLLRPIAAAIIPSACAVICIAPVSVAAFGGISLVGVFATVVLMPLFTVALMFTVLFALSGMTPLVIPVSLSVKAAYSVILFFGSDSRLWLVLDFKGACILVLLTSAAVAAAALCPKRASYACLCFAVAGSIAAVMLSKASEYNRRKIDFVSNGSSGAAVICIKDEATVLICGGGDGMDIRISDCLLRNGIHHLRLVAASGINTSGCLSVGSLNELYPIDEISADSFAEKLGDICPNAAVTQRSISSVCIDGVSIAAAKAGDTECKADIVIYTGYKMSVPQYGAQLIPLYASSRQTFLPDSGINIYNDNFELKLEN